MTVRPVEWVLGGYAALVLAIAAARTSIAPSAAWVALAHGLLLFLLVLFQRVGDRGIGSLLRDVAPIVLLLALYGAIDTVNQAGGRPTLDPLVQGWEQTMFGGQPSQDWWRTHPSAMWSSVLHAAYFSYFAIIPFPIALFLWRRQAPSARRAVLTIISAFVVCYVCFILFPVAGPYYEFARPDAAFVDNTPARLVYAMLARGSSYGAAFPSSHVAGTWAAVAATATGGSPGWALALGVPAALLTVGVVYTQMHYGVDVLAGLGVAVLAIGMAAGLQKKRAGSPPARPSSPGAEPNQRTS